MKMLLKKRKNFKIQKNKNLKNLSKNLNQAEKIANKNMINKLAKLINLTLKINLKIQKTGGKK